MDKAQAEFIRRVKAHLSKPGCQAVIVYTWPESGEQYTQVDVCGLSNRLEVNGLLEVGKMVVLRVLPVKKAKEASQ